jgi:hypothetical protein
MVDARMGYETRVMGKSIERLFENERLRSNRSSPLRRTLRVHDQHTVMFENKERQLWL